VRDWKRWHEHRLFSVLDTCYWGRSICRDFTNFRAFKMLSRNAFRLQGASKAIRSFSIAAQVITLLLHFRHYRFVTNGS
jgi:hypothetical protein